MDWARKNYERVALGVATAILLLSGIWISYRAIHFNEQFATTQPRPPQLPAAPPGKATAVETAAQHLRQPPQWTFSGRSGLFVPEKHFIGADGQPATLHTTEVHPPVPNEWFEQFGLPIADGDVLDQDPDGDGFTNFDEWEGHTNPTDRNSHPDYVTKLKLKSFTQESFRFVFASRTEDTFGINTIDLKEPTQFVRIGDMIAGTPYRVSTFKEKFERNKYGTNVDVSELILENVNTFERKPVRVLLHDRQHAVVANDGALVQGMFVVQSAAAQLDRMVKAASGSGVPKGYHIHADGSLHKNHDEDK